jgi:hypothetical protein
MFPVGRPSQPVIVFRTRGLYRDRNTGLGGRDEDMVLIPQVVQGPLFHPGHFRAISRDGNLLELVGGKDSINEVVQNARRGEK